VHCGRADPSDRAAVLASVLGAAPSAAPAFERRAAEQGLDLSLLWALRTDGRIEGGAMLVPHPGRTALLMATAPRDIDHARRLGQLVQATLRDSLSLPEVRLIQALSSPGETLRAAAWTAGGLRHLASLDYMERPQPADVPAALPGPVIALVPWEAADRDGLERLLVETYVETLDCPGLAQMRTPRDILDGHLAAGEHDPALWTIAFRGARAVGALLLSPSAATDSVEVVYLGIVPEARGRGLGRAMLAHGMRLAAHRRERTLALAVDARNTPAVALYARSGFRTVRRREAFVAHPAPYPAASAAVK